MKAHDIEAKMYRRFKKTTKRSSTIIHRPDLVQQNFCVPQPNRVWVSDITYICVHRQWVYLAVVLDLFSRKVVGMALQDRMTGDLVIKALYQAFLNRRPPKGLIHHSDLGSQYTSQGLRQFAQKHGITLSYGASAYDNAVMESFFHTLKTRTESVLLCPFKITVPERQRKRKDDEARTFFLSRIENSGHGSRVSESAIAHIDHSLSFEEGIVRLQSSLTCQLHRGIQTPIEGVYDE